MDDLDCRKTFRLMMATRSSTRVKKNSKFLPLAVQLGRYFMLSQLIRDDCKSTQTAKRRMRSRSTKGEREQGLREVRDREESVSYSHRSLVELVKLYSRLFFLVFHYPLLFSCCLALRYEKKGGSAAHSTAAAFSVRGAHVPLLFRVFACSSTQYHLHSPLPLTLLGSSYCCNCKGLPNIFPFFFLLYAHGLRTFLRRCLSSFLIRF